MIEITTIASGSTGNAYRISDGQTSLLLEAGMSLKKIQQALNYKISDVVGCLITHEHMDHAKYTQQILDAAINCYTSQGTKDALNINHHRLHTVSNKTPFKIGTWTILPFDVQHDVNEPYGYLIQSKDGDKLLFATDTYYIKYRFTGLNYLMVECNYCQSVLDDNVERGIVPRFQKRRVMKSHFSLENLVEFLKANDLSAVKEIHLLHLSDRNSNERMIYETVAKTTGKQIVIAK